MRLPQNQLDALKLKASAKGMPYSISKSSVHFVGFASRTFVLSSLRLRVHE
jgi:hypothetical protein